MDWAENSKMGQEILKYFDLALLAAYIRDLTVDMTVAYGIKKQGMRTDHSR